MSKDEPGPSARVDTQHVSGGVGVLVQEAAPRYPRFASNLRDHGQEPFVGRDADMARLAERLADTDTSRVIALCGHSGVGKTTLAERFARQNASRYPGGVFFIRVDGPGAPVDLARVGKEQLGLGAAPHDDIETQCRRALAALGHEPTLLIYDDVPGPAILDTWAPPPMRRFHVLVTSTWEDWEGRREVMHVRHLDAGASRELCDQIAGTFEIPEHERRTIIEQAGGLPVELCTAASAAARAVKRNRQRSILPLQPATASSFERAWSLLDADARLALRAAALFEPQRIPEPALLALLEAAGMAPALAEDAVDACRDRHLLATDLRMHALVAEFVRARAEPALPDSLIAAHARAFADAADRVTRNPANLDAVRDLDAYPAGIARWRALGAEEILADAAVAVARAWYERGRFAEALAWALAAPQAASQALTESAGAVDHEHLNRSLHMVGACYSAQGAWEQARPWFERAVTEAEQGDVHGRVDHESLGASLHQLGRCYGAQGAWEQARPWFERSVAEAQQGDVYGRVDHESLGISLHQVGWCYSAQGAWEQARPWFERAVTEKQQGDVHGRVDHESLGRSLHMVGVCFSAQGAREQARPWFERAVAEKQQGDVHGRVDHESLGRSLHMMGMCYSEQGAWEQARPWFERAVAEVEQGDVHGRVDHESLGASLHQVGMCYSEQGAWEQARPWFERAIAEKQQGDVHGRVDHRSLGTSLHEVGWCFSAQGAWEQARPWFERAVAEKQQGDVYGRVDHRSLGTSLYMLAQMLRSLGQERRASELAGRALDAARRGDVFGRVDSAFIEAIEHFLDSSRA